MTALSDFTLPLLISSSDPLQIPSSLIILIGRFVGGHLKDDHTQENNIKGLAIQESKGGKKRAYLTFVKPFTLFSKAH